MLDSNNIFSFTNIIGLTSFVLYSLLGLISLSSTCFSILAPFCIKITSRDSRTGVIVQRLFHLFLLLFVGVRLTWFELRFFENSTDLAFILDRLAFLLFFTCFTLIIFYWAETFHRSYVYSIGFLPQLGFTLVFFNISIWILQTIFVVLYFFNAEGESVSSNKFYQINIFIDIITSFLIALGFFVYGVRLFVKGYKNEEDESSTLMQKKAKGRKGKLFRIVVATTLLVLCFLLRVVIFIYEPLAKDKLSNEIYYTAAYFIPEIIPSILLLYLVHNSSGTREKATKFIDNLYDENEYDSQKDFNITVYDSGPISEKLLSETYFSE